MIDIATTIQTYLSTYWTVSYNPLITELTFRQDEMDPKNPNLQILLENMPDKKTWVREDLQRIEHQCRITIFVKPINYDEATITIFKTKFLNMKSEIDKIILKYMFSISPNIILEGWNDGITLQVGRGTKNLQITENEMKSDRQEPIIFQSKQIVSCWYYQYSGSGTTNVPLRVYNITLGMTPYTWTGITDMNWVDNDPWVMIEIPGGPMVHQHLHPVHVMGEIIVRDISPMSTALFKTVINSDGKYAIDTDGKKWKILNFVVAVITNTGTLTATFDNARIQSVSFEKIQLGQDNLVRIKFMADKVSYSGV